MNNKQADVWIVAGPPGGGKTTVADALLSLPDPVPALLDKDTIYGSFVKATLAAAGLPPTARRGPWYDEHVKIHEYTGLTETTREIRSKGCPVLLSAPFTKQIQDANPWHEWVTALGGGTVRLVWINTDAETLRVRLEQRGSDRGDAKDLANFQQFLDYMKPGTPPPVPHIAIDNRLSATESIEDQLKAALARLK